MNQSATKRGKTSSHYLLYLTLGALGIVYGDLGTSPLYTMKECFHGSHGVDVTPANILGVLSLIFWSLLTVISIKYVLFVMRADNNGEGGVLALMALASKDPKATMTRRRKVIVALGLFGAALLYGDGMITPAISVLSAIEGLNVGTKIFEPYVLPLTVVILILLFTMQQVGTGRIGIIFGPFILLWFFSIGAMGAASIVHHPQVLAAVNPVYGISFLLEHGATHFEVLGSVFLALTGAEALYADMGHFGIKPIRVGWTFVAFPCLLLNYFGQGALLMLQPDAVENPFYRLAPGWALYPLVLMATLATSIASQAVIAGAFSLTRQAIQLGYLPRLTTIHTSSEEIGQIYIPMVNWGLLLATLWLVVEFETSTNLAAAYGIAVSTTMLFTTVLIFVVAREVWKWSLAKAIAAVAPFLAIDTLFFSANFVKVAKGGWFPILIGLLVFTLMTTWRKGRIILASRLKAAMMPFPDFLRDIPKLCQVRVPGTAVFLSGSSDGVPLALIHNLKHNRVLHEQVILMMAVTESIPHVPIENRISIAYEGQGIIRIVVRYGFKDSPNIPGALRLARSQGISLKLSEVTYFLGKETLVATKRPGMAIWREKLFAFMSANAQRANSFFRLPANQVVEIGLQVEL